MNKLIAVSLALGWISIVILIANIPRPSLRTIEGICLLTFLIASGTIISYYVWQAVVIFWKETGQ